MTTNYSGSAMIYTFPPRGRFAAGHGLAERQPAQSAPLPPGAKLVSGSGWYHDEAIEQAREQGRKN
jgi:hypothetical protein